MWWVIWCSSWFPLAKLYAHFQVSSKCIFKWAPSVFSLPPNNTVCLVLENTAIHIKRADECWFKSVIYRRGDVDCLDSQSSLQESLRTCIYIGKEDSQLRGNKVAPYSQLCRFYEERDFCTLSSHIPCAYHRMCPRKAGSTEIHKRNKQSEYSFLLLSLIC